MSAYDTTWNSSLPLPAAWLAPAMPPPPLRSLFCYCCGFSLPRGQPAGLLPFRDVFHSAGSAGVCVFMWLGVHPPSKTGFLCVAILSVLELPPSFKLSFEVTIHVIGAPVWALHKQLPLLHSGLSCSLPHCPSSCSPSPPAASPFPSSSSILLSRIFHSLLALFLISFKSLPLFSRPSL